VTVLIFRDASRRDSMDEAIEDARSAIAHVELLIEARGLPEVSQLNATLTARIKDAVLAVIDVPWNVLCPAEKINITVPR